MAPVAEAEAATDSNIIDIPDSSDASILFDVDNMKPGDWATRELIVNNTHDKEMLYNMEIIFIDGSKKLYEQLKFNLTDQSNTVFTGKIIDFPNRKDTPIEANSKQNLELTLDFPEELGNEYQGLAVEFEVRFTMKDNLTVTSLSNDSPLSFQPVEQDLSFTPKETVTAKLPNTATTMFTLLLFGTAFLMLGLVVFLIYRKTNPELLQLIKK